MLAGAAAALFLPASRAVIPQIVPEERLQSANALLRLTRNTTSIVNPARVTESTILVGPLAQAWGSSQTLLAAGLLLTLCTLATVVSRSVRNLPGLPTQRPGTLQV